MSLFDSLTNLLAPYDCLACGLEGEPLCSSCLNRLVRLPGRCYRCRRLSPTCLTCSTCRAISSLYRVQAVTTYDGIAKQLIWQLKFNGAQAAARIMARRQAELIGVDRVEDIVVPVPTATSRMRRRGYDQAKLLARELARQTHLSYQDCLVRSGQGYQHGLSRRERLTQLATSFRVNPRAIQAVHIILVDDVVTTGATLEAAARVLQAAGARRVEAIVFAQP